MFWIKSNRLFLACPEFLECDPHKAWWLWQLLDSTRKSWEIRAAKRETRNQTHELNVKIMTGCKKKTSHQGLHDIEIDFLLQLQKTSRQTWTNIGLIIKFEWNKILKKQSRITNHVLTESSNNGSKWQAWMTKTQKRARAIARCDKFNGSINLLLPQGKPEEVLSEYDLLPEEVIEKGLPRRQRQN